MSLRVCYVVNLLQRWAVLEFCYQVWYCKVGTTRSLWDTCTVPHAPALYLEFAWNPHAGCSLVEFQCSLIEIFIFFIRHSNRPVKLALTRSIRRPTGTYLRYKGVPITVTVTCHRHDRDGATNGCRDSETEPTHSDGP
jgi:hypothetical protein